MSEASAAVRAWMERGEPTTTEGEPVRCDEVEEIVRDRDALRWQLGEQRRAADALADAVRDCDALDTHEDDPSHRDGVRAVYAAARAYRAARSRRPAAPEPAVLHWTLVGKIGRDEHIALVAAGAPAAHGWIVAHAHDDVLRALLRDEVVSVRLDGSTVAEILEGSKGRTS